MTPLAVTVGEAADLIGISESLTWRLLAEGSLHRVKIGRRTLIRVAELDRFLADHEQTRNGTEPADAATTPREAPLPSSHGTRRTEANDE